jgi:Rrf2 family nitric oxide-sensitive transcriptional repressor
MQLNVTTDYAIRAMVFLAEEKRLVTGVEIANKMQIPAAYLLSIMGSLKKAGFITGKRGNVGGYALERPLDEISLWDIMTVTEGTLQLAPCLENDPFASSESTGMGRVRRVYQDLQGDMEARLRGVTLKQLVDGSSTG